MEQKVAQRWVDYSVPLQRLFVRIGVLPFLLVIALIVFNALSPRFLTSENLITVARQATYLAIVAMGQMLALLTGGFDLSVGKIVAWQVRRAAPSDGAPSSDNAGASSAEASPPMRGHTTYA